MIDSLCGFDFGNGVTSSPFLVFLIYNLYERMLDRIFLFTAPHHPSFLSLADTNETVLYDLQKRIYSIEDNIKVIF